MGEDHHRRRGTSREPAKAAKPEPNGERDDDAPPEGSARANSTARAETARLQKRRQRRGDQIDEAERDQHAGHRVAPKAAVEAEPFEEAEHHRLRQGPCSSRPTTPNQTTGGMLTPRRRHAAPTARARGKRQRARRARPPPSRRRTPRTRPRRRTPRSDCGVAPRNRMANTPRANSTMREQPMRIGAVGDRAVRDAERRSRRRRPPATCSAASAAKPDAREATQERDRRHREARPSRQARALMRLKREREEQARRRRRRRGTASTRPPACGGSNP